MNIRKYEFVEIIWFYFLLEDRVGAGRTKKEEELIIFKDEKRNIDLFFDNLHVSVGL
jgi:hypothetical protein